MLNEPTTQKLHDLRLRAMAEAWQHQARDASLGSLSFEERFALLVDAEHLARYNRRLDRFLKEADLRLPSAVVENVEASTARGLEKATLRQLGTCSFVNEHLNVLITGSTGVGKSYLACALGNAACRKGLRVIYRRAPRLFDELALSKADGTHARAMAKIARADLLILDDLGIGTLKEAQRHDLLEVLDDRYGCSATIVTSQLPVDKWYEWIDEPTIADAILDRLVHNAYKIALQGNSKRKDDKNKNQ